MGKSRENGDRTGEKPAPGQERRADQWRPHRRGRESLHVMGWWEKGAFEPGIGAEDGRKRTAGAPPTVAEKTRPEFREEEGRAIGLSSPSGVLVPGQRLLTAAGLAGARGPGGGPAQRGERPLLTGKGQERNLVRGGAGGEDGTESHARTPVTSACLRTTLSGLSRLPRRR